MSGRSPPPPWLLALGRAEPPNAIEVNGATYRLVEFFKHDFFAATALYEGMDRKVVLKIGRRARLFGLPMEWAGRFLGAREARMYRVFQGIEGVPAFLGKWGRTGLVHAYVEGRPLSRDSRVDDAFFARLAAIIEQIHARGAAYVDLEKPENVLLGDDGRPYLVDFQISWGAFRSGLGDRWPLSAVRRVLQASDRYHLLKHRRRLRPDQLSEEELARSGRPPFWIAWHRALFRPVTLLRRWVLVRLGVRESARVRSPG